MHKFDIMQKLYNKRKTFQLSSWEKRGDDSQKIFKNAYFDKGGIGYCDPEDGANGSNSWSEYALGYYS